MLRLHRIPHSTNVQRVALAAAIKGLPVTYVDHDAADRSALLALSGQELVPVVELPGGEVLTDSPRILARLEADHPEPPLLPADPARRREQEAFCDWFNHVWKRPPNAIDAHRRAGGSPDDPRVAAWAAQVHAYQHGFEALLHDRPFLFGDRPGLADVTAAPFLRFTSGLAGPDDDDLFHGVLVELLPGDFPRIEAWSARVLALLP
jgi:maleylpyruvate isomerase